MKFILCMGYTAPMVEAFVYEADGSTSQVDFDGSENAFSI